MNEMTMGEEEAAARAALPMFLEVAETALGERAKAQAVPILHFDDDVPFWIVAVVAEIFVGPDRWRNVVKSSLPFSREQAEQGAEILAKWVDEKIAP